LAEQRRRRRSRTFGAPPHQNPSRARARHQSSLTDRSPVARRRRPGNHRILPRAQKAETCRSRRRRPPNRSPRPRVQGRRANRAAVPAQDGCGVPNRVSQPNRQPAHDRRHRPAPSRRRQRQSKRNHRHRRRRRSALVLWLRRSRSDSLRSRRPARRYSPNHRLLTPLAMLEADGAGARGRRRAHQAHRGVRPGDQRRRAARPEKRHPSRSGCLNLRHRRPNRSGRAQRCQASRAVRGCCGQWRPQATPGGAVAAGPRPHDRPATPP